MFVALPVVEKNKSWWTLLVNGAHVLSGAARALGVVFVRSQCRIMVLLS